MKSINLIKTLTIFFFLVSSTSVLSAQECLDQLKQLYQNMETKMTENEGGIFHLKYQMTNVVGANKGGQTMSTRVEILSQGNKSYYISDQASIFQDVAITYTVMPAEREIILTPNTGESIKQARLNQITNMQQRILSVASLKSCSDINRNGNNLKQIVISMPKAEQTATNIKEIEFVVDMESFTLLESTILYLKTEEIVSSKIVYETINYNASTDRFQQPVAQEVFTSGQEPIGLYKGYKVINYTNQ